MNDECTLLQTNTHLHVHAQTRRCVRHSSEGIYERCVFVLGHLLCLMLSMIICMDIAVQSVLRDGGLDLSGHTKMLIKCVFCHCLLFSLFISVYLFFSIHMCHW